jgi:phosphinothricin acetyltransferase
MNITFKEIAEIDLGLVKEIYNYYIINSTVTFHTEKVSVEELKEMLPVMNSLYKSYLIYYGSDICGYCYFTEYKKKQAYKRTADIAIYLKPGFTGKGIGKISLDHLEKMAKSSGIKTLLAFISEGNMQSVNLFEKNRFSKCAHFKEVGEKFGKILDVYGYQKNLDNS